MWAFAKHWGKMQCQPAVQWPGDGEGVERRAVRKLLAEKPRELDNKE